MWEYVKVEELTTDVDKVLTHVIPFLQHTGCLTRATVRA